MIKGLLFDMDGVLIDGMPYHWRSWQLAMRAMGVEIERLEIYKREGEQGAVTAKDLLTMGGVTPTPDRIQRVLSHKEELFSRLYRPGKTIPHAKALLKFTTALPDAPRHVLVTGTSHGEWKKVFPTDWKPLFKEVVTGDQVKKGKPHPEPYLTGLKRAGLKPHEALVIENAPYGIRSAKAAGLRVLAVQTSLPEEHLEEADEIYTDLKALRIGLQRHLNHG